MTQQAVTSVVCPACSHGALVTCLDLRDYVVARCAHCGLYVNSTFYSDAAFRESLFRSSYYDDNAAFRHRAQQYGQDPSLPFYGRCLDEVERMIPPGRVLDVGCAFGNFLKLAHDRGWKPSGVEPSAYSSAVARDAWGFEVFTGPLTECPFAAGSFDLVTFWDVIEHVESPRADLEKARELLRTGGCIVLSTDDAAGLIASLGRLLYQGGLGTLRYPARKFFIRFNSCYFTADILNELLQRCGFSVRHVAGIDYPLAKLNVTGLERQIARLLYLAGRVVRRRSQFLMIAQAV